MAIKKVFVHLNRAKPTYFRGLHYIEGGRKIPWYMPEVIPPIDQIRLRMTADIQVMSFGILKYYYQEATGKTWRALHKCGLCLNNEAQDGFDCGIPLRDYVNMIDTTSSQWPNYDKMQRTFQGSRISGIKTNGEIRLYPGEDCIDATKPMPSTQVIIEKGWFSVGVNIGPQHNPVPSLFAQGKGNWCIYPMIADQMIRFPSDYFIEWTDPQLPDPTKVYLEPVL